MLLKPSFEGEVEMKLTKGRERLLRRAGNGPSNDHKGRDCIYDIGWCIPELQVVWGHWEERVCQRSDRC